MTKLGLILFSALLTPLLASSDAAAHRRCHGARHCKVSPTTFLQHARHHSVMPDQHDHYRGYMHGYVDGYRRAQQLYFSHARHHVRRKVVRLAPGPSYYEGQIDPWWRSRLDY